MSPPWHVQPTFTELANAKSPEFIHPNYQYKDATNSFALGRLLGNFQNVQATEEAELHASRVDSIIKDVSSVHGLPKDVLKALYHRAKDEGLLPPDAYDLPKHRKVYRKGDLKDGSTQTERKTLVRDGGSAGGYVPIAGPQPVSVETQTINVETSVRTTETQTYRSVQSRGTETESAASSSLIPAPPGAPAGTSGKDLLLGKTAAEMPAPSSASSSYTPRVPQSLSDLIKGEVSSIRETVGPFMQQLVVKATAKEKLEQNAKKEELSAGRLLATIAQRNLTLAQDKLNSETSRQFQRGLFNIGKDVFETAKKLVSPQRFGMLGARVIQTAVSQRKQLLDQPSGVVSAIMKAGREPVEAGRTMEEMIPEVMGRLQAAAQLPSEQRRSAMEELAKFLTDDEALKKSLTGDLVQGLWNSIVEGHRVHGVNREVLKQRVKQEADVAWAKGDKLKFDLLNGLFDLYAEEKTPYSAPIEAAAASSSSRVVQHITETELYRKRLEEAARMVAQMQSSPSEPDAGPPLIPRTPDGEAPTLNLETGERRSVYVSTPEDYAEMYRSLHSNLTLVAQAATSSSSTGAASSSSGASMFVPAKYRSAREDPGVFFTPMPASSSSSDKPEQPHHEMAMERIKSRKVQVETKDPQGHIVMTTKRIFVPSTHKDEDERYRNAQRAANQETSQEAQILEKKARFQRRRQNFYG